jgi:phospholipase C
MGMFNFTGSGNNSTVFVDPNLGSVVPSVPAI